MVRVPTPSTLALILAGAGILWMTIRWGNSAIAPHALYSSHTKKLSDCPNRPNCVCSSASRPGNQLAAIDVSESPAAAMAKLTAIIQRMPGASVVRVQDNYLRAEFRSRVFGFVDDLELLVEENGQRIGVRSASRIGYSDLGANRKRVETIRRLYQAASAADNA